MEPLRLVSFGGDCYEPITFEPPVPQPIEPVTEPMPHEKRDVQRMKEQMQMHEKEVHQSEKLEEARNKGLLDKLDAVYTSAITAVERGIRLVANRAADEFVLHNEQHAYARFKRHFPHMVNEKLLGDFRCKLCTKNGTLSGFLQVTSNHFFFIGEDEMEFVCPLSEIISIQRLRPAEGASGDQPDPPHFIAVSDQNADAEAFQLFMSSKQLLIFKDFLSLRAMPADIAQEALNVIDHCWRACTTVPNPCWEYIEPERYPQPKLHVIPPSKSFIVRSPSKWQRTRPTACSGVRTNGNAPPVHCACCPFAHAHLQVQQQQQQQQAQVQAAQATDADSHRTVKHADPESQLSSKLTEHLEQQQSLTSQG